MALPTARAARKGHAPARRTTARAPARPRPAARQRRLAPTTTARLPRGARSRPRREHRVEGTGRSAAGHGQSSLGSPDLLTSTTCPRRQFAYLPAQMSAPLQRIFVMPTARLCRVERKTSARTEPLGRPSRHNRRRSRSSQALQERKQAIGGLVTSPGDVAWFRTGEGLFLDGEVGVVVDVGGADAFVA